VQCNIAGGVLGERDKEKIT